MNTWLFFLLLASSASIIALFGKDFLNMVKNVQDEMNGETQPMPIRGLTGIAVDFSATGATFSIQLDTGEVVFFRYGEQACYNFCLRFLAEKAKADKAKAG